MRHILCITITIAGVLSAGISVSSRLDAQDQTAKDSTLTFHARTVADPADPDPSQQTPAERLVTLRKRMSDAIAVLDKRDLRTFFNDYIDPFWVARAAADSEGTVEEFLTKQIFDSREFSAATTKRFKQVLTRTLNAEPKWLLNGRAASFKTDRSSRSAEFWIYFEGKWRISPET